MIPKINKILYTTDLSLNAAYVFRYACNSAEKHNATIDILHVVQSGTGLGNKLPAAEKESIIKKLNKRIELLTKEELRENPSFVSRVSEIHVKAGNPVDVILQAVKDLKPDIILMGTHSKGMLEKAFLGSVAVSAALAATFEALYSAYSRMQVQRTWDSILNAPVTLDDIVFAEMLWAALKALFSVSAIIVVIFLLGISRAPSMLLALPVLCAVGITFASIALVFNALAQGYDFFTYYFTLVLTPMTFLSGVYFPIEQMPVWLQHVAHVLPLTAAVDLVRPLILGRWPVKLIQPMAVLAAYAACGYFVALVLTRRRFLR